VSTLRSVSKKVSAKVMVEPAGAVMVVEQDNMLP
jgi:hypothetical protein